MSKAGADIFSYLGMQPSLDCKGECNVTHSVFRPEIGYGVQKASFVTQTNVYKAVGSGIVVGVDGVALSNAVWSSGEGYTGSGSSKMVMHGNAAWENEVSFSFMEGYGCKPENFRNQTGHQSSIGFRCKGSCSSRTRPIHDLVMYGIGHVAIWAFSPSSTPLITNVRIADFETGFIWGGVGASPISHAAVMKTVFLEDSLFVGRSFNEPRSGVQVGVHLVVFSSQGASITPDQCTPLGGRYTYGIYGTEFPIGSDPAIAGEFRVARVTFLRFQANGGSSVVVKTLMRGGMESADAVHPAFFSQITIDQVSRENLASLPPPKRSWITLAKCVVWDCDGPKHPIVHDLDGSLMGRGADASITGKAEYMNERRAHLNKYTWRVLSKTRTPRSIELQNARAHPSSPPRD